MEIEIEKLNETRREWKGMNDMVNQTSVIEVSISCKRIAFWEVEILTENLKKGLQNGKCTHIWSNGIIAAKQTYKDISMVLQQRYPGERGFSEMSVHHFYGSKGLTTNNEVASITSNAVEKVVIYLLFCKSILNLFSLGFWCTLDKAFSFCFNFLKVKAMFLLNLYGFFQTNVKFSYRIWSGELS